MTTRHVAFIIKDQDPVLLSPEASVQQACARMWERRVGAVLVADPGRRLVGIFTGRDAVRALAEGRDPSHTALASVMTRDPKTIAPEQTAIDALREMGDGGFRHLPVVVEGNLVIGIVSRGDFRGLELDRFETETALWERIR
jgi:CBS domain-containing protein